MLQLRYLLSQHVRLKLNTSVTICYQPSGRDQVGTFLTGKFSTMLMIVAHEPFVAAVHYSFIQGGEWIGILSQRGDLYQEDWLSHHITFSRRLFPICGAWAFLLVANWNAEKWERDGCLSCPVWPTPVTSAARQKLIVRRGSTSLPYLTKLESRSPFSALLL